MNKEFLSQPQFSKQNIMENVFAPHNFDAIKAQQDINALVREENQRVFARRLAFFSTGGILFSLYNVTRIGQLSPSGRVGSILGTVLFTHLTYVSLNKGGVLGRSIPTATKPEEQQKQQQQQEENKH